MDLKHAFFLFIWTQGYIVEESSYCASSNSGWQIASFVYLLVLLLIAAAIATQNRDIRQEFNESRYMALLLYSHGMFMVLKLSVSRID